MQLGQAAAVYLPGLTMILGSPAGKFYTGVDTVTLRRPGGGVGGHAWDEHLSRMHTYGSSARQVFAHWDLPMIQWLESAGY